jgi:anti-sigma B factor antagonist
VRGGAQSRQDGDGDTMDPSAGPTGPEGITVAEHDGAVLVVLRGEVDAALRADASRAMVTVVSSDGPVTVDASEVTFIDSSGLAFLLQLQRVVTDAGRPLVLRDPTGIVRRVLALVGLDRLFPTAEAQGV